MASANQELPDPPADPISAVNFAPNSNRLLVSSWDRNVYLYEVDEPSNLVEKYEMRAPVLDVCFGEDDKEAFCGGLDCDVRRIDLSSGEQQVLSTHEAPVKSVVYSPNTQLCISGSWDSTLHIHTLGSPSSAPAIIPLPSKVYSMSLTPTKLVVAMANRAVNIYDLAALKMALQQSSSDPGPLEMEPFQSRESSMKFMTRAASCMPDGAGYATSSIEGRVAVEWFDPSEESQSRKYAFKCHRQTLEGVEMVYPVNALAFHPSHLTFATGGGDGVVALWDALGKRRIRQYHPYGGSVAAMAFSQDGKWLAVGVSPGFEDGKEDLEGTISVFIRQLSDSEAKPRAR